MNNSLSNISTIYSYYYTVDEAFQSIGSIWPMDIYYIYGYSTLT